MAGEKTAKQISEELYKFLLDNKINKKLEYKIKALNDIGEVNVASEYETSWKTVMQVLDEWYLFLKKKKSHSTAICKY